LYLFGNFCRGKDFGKEHSKRIDMSRILNIRETFTWRRFHAENIATKKILSINLGEYCVFSIFLAFVLHRRRKIYDLCEEASKLSSLRIKHLTKILREENVRGENSCQLFNGRKFFALTFLNWMKGPKRLKQEGK
jgi:hypothetical protein